MRVYYTACSSLALQPCQVAVTVSLRVTLGAVCLRHGDVTAILTVQTTVMSICALEVSSSYYRPVNIAFSQRIIEHKLKKKIVTNFILLKDSFFSAMHWSSGRAQPVSLST